MAATQPTSTRSTWRHGDAGLRDMRPSAPRATGAAGGVAGGRHQSRTFPGSGDRVVRSVTCPPSGSRRQGLGAREHVEQAAGHRRGGRAAVAGLLHEDRHGVVRVGGRSERPEHGGGGLAEHLGRTRLGRDREGGVREAAERPEGGAARSGWSPPPCRRRWPGGPSGEIDDLALLVGGDLALHLVGEPVLDLLHDLRRPAGAAVGRAWRRPTASCSGVTSTSPWPMASLTFLPVRQLGLLAGARGLDGLAVLRQPRRRGHAARAARRAGRCRCRCGSPTS